MAFGEALRRPIFLHDFVGGSGLAFPGDALGPQGALGGGLVRSPVLVLVLCVPANEKIEPACVETLRVEDDEAPLAPA